jgi:hypothetical protein
MARTQAAACGEKPFILKKAAWFVAAWPMAAGMAGAAPHSER